MTGDQQGFTTLHLIKQLRKARFGIGSLNLTHYEYFQLVELTGQNRRRTAKCQFRNLLVRRLRYIITFPSFSFPAEAAARMKSALFPLLVINLAAPAFGQSTSTTTIIVTAKRLDQARSRIAPGLGASITRFSAANIRDLPQGADTKLDLMLTQAPGVALDSYGQLHVRGDHGDLQYRLDGVQLPEGLSGFGQDLSSRIAQSTELITGALPAQYGVLQAGVINLTLKSGRTDPGGDISIEGGARDEFETAFDDGASRGNFDWFVTADAVHTRLGIENPTGSFNAIQDLSNQEHTLIKLGDILSGDARLDLIAGLFDGNFQIPDNPGQPQLFPVQGPVPRSSALRDNQTEHTEFSILSLQQQIGAIDLQSSAFSRASSLAFSPDPTGDLA